MIVLVCGGRDFKDRDLLFTTMDAIDDKYGLDFVVHGAARGADLLAEEWAKSREIRYMGFPARWKDYGRAAGPIRNEYMLRRSGAGLVVAFPGGAGTANMMKLARDNGVSVIEIKTPKPADDLL